MVREGEKQTSSDHDDDDDDDCVSLSLPEDIIFEVLVRVPAKALCRFRCVSKAWRAVISDPALVAAQRSHAGPLIVAVFCLWPHHELRVLDMDGNVLWVLEAIGSTLLAPTRLDLICVDMLRLGAMIVDPAARRAFTVGGNENELSTWSDSSFGRAAPSGTYKVLRLHIHQALGSDVATITDGGAAEPTTWRQRPPPPFVTCFTSERKATVNGVLYFMPDSAYAEGTHRVVAFDLESEAWKETIDGPPLRLNDEMEEWPVSIAELKGTLCMVHIVRHAYSLMSCHCANVWRLVDYDENVWVKAYTIKMPPNCSCIKPLDVLDDGRILLLHNICNKYILQFFNPSTEEFTHIMEMADGFSGRMTFYTGSLLSS